LDGNEIAARLKHLKGAQAECPQCGKTEWENPPDDGRFLLSVTHAKHGYGEQLPLVVLICHNCGFVRFHDEEKLHD